MHIIKHKDNLSIKNLDSVCENNETERRHGVLLPSSIRCIIVGPSNCGKTNVIISLLIHPNGLCFKNIYIFSKSLYQSKYEYLRKVLEPIKDIGYYTYNNSTEILKPNEAKDHSVFVFDDVISENQLPIRMYFSMGRHRKVDSFFLGQSYSRIGKQLIRDNCNFLIVFKQDDTNLRHIYSDHVSPDMSFQRFQDMCAICWNEKYGFLVIDKDRELENGRYRKEFDGFIYL